MRSRLIYLTMLLVPLAVYWPVLATEFGKLGDYGQIRSAQSAVELAASSAGSTLVYRALLESSFAVVNGVPMLAGVRLVTVLLLGALGILLWRQLDGSGWPEFDSAVVGMLVVLLPSAQICVGWAQCWPQVLGLHFAVAGFAAVETELEVGGLKRVVAMAGGALIYVVATLINPTVLMFALVPMAAVLMFKLRKTGQPLRTNVNWFVLHLVVLGAGLAAGRILDRYFDGTALLDLSSLKATLLWIVADAVPGALAGFALRDDFHAGAWYFWPAAAGVAFWLYYFVRRENATGDELVRQKTVICYAAIPATLLAGTILAGPPGPIGYRSMFAFSGLVVVLVVASMQALQREKVIKKWMHRTLLVALVLLGALAAHFNTTSWIVEPQAREWELVRTSVREAKFNPKMKVFLVTAGAEDRTTGRRFGDEFGSVSSRHAGVLKEMFIAAAEQEGWPKQAEMNITVGAEAPRAGLYDVVVDMRQLRHGAARD